MTGIVANALGLEALPSAATVADLVDRFSLEHHGLLGQPHRSALLAINGEHDAYVPPVDTTTFDADPNATAWVIKQASHCAAEHLAVVIPAAIGWLTARLHGDARRYRLLETALRLPLKPLLARRG